MVPHDADKAGKTPGGLLRVAWVPPAILALLALASFAAGLGGGFVLDDHLAIVQHPVVQGRAGLLDAFRLNFWGDSLGAVPPSFRPLATLSFALDRRLLGSWPLGFHVSSLAWYICLVLAAWAFARRCLGNRAAALAMAFFVVMPVHVENVTSLVGRADTLGALCGVLALLAMAPTLVEGQETPVWRLALAGAAFAAALLCKESMAALPVIVALFTEHRRRTRGSLTFARAHLPSLVMAAILGAYVLVRLRLQPTTFSYTAKDDVLVGANAWEKLGYGLELVARYAGLVVAPTRLCTGRKFAEVFLPAQVSLSMVLGAGLLGLGAFLSWRNYRRGEFPLVAAAFAAWFPVTGLVFAMPESMADRFLLLPSVFLSLAAGPALAWLWDRGRTSRALVALAVAAQLVLSNRQARTWHDEGTLLAHAVRVCPNSVHNHVRYAKYLSQTGQTGEAVWHFAVATKGFHAFPHAWSHPAMDAERRMPIDERLPSMYRLLGFTIDEEVWRERFEAYLRSLGRWREAGLVSELRARK